MMRLSPTRWPTPPNARWRFCRARRSPRASWNDYGGIIVVRRAGRGRRACPTVSRPSIWRSPPPIPKRCWRKVRHAGAIFLGRHTPEAMGDYIAGPNHVLPTSRSARFSSGLSVLDFMKRTTLLSLDAGRHRRAGPRRHHPGRSRRPGGPCPLHRRAAEPEKPGLTWISASRHHAGRTQRRAAQPRHRAGTRSRDLRSAGSNIFRPEGSPRRALSPDARRGGKPPGVRYRRWKTAASRMAG